MLNNISEFFYTIHALIEADQITVCAQTSSVLQSTSRFIYTLSAYCTVQNMLFSIKA